MASRSLVVIFSRRGDLDPWRSLEALDPIFDIDFARWVRFCGSRGPKRAPGPKSETSNLDEESSSTTRRQRRLAARRGAAPARGRAPRAVGPLDGQPFGVCQGARRDQGAAPDQPLLGELWSLTPLGDPSTSTPLSRDRRHDGFPQGGMDHSSPRSGWSVREVQGVGRPGSWGPREPRETRRSTECLGSPGRPGGPGSKGLTSRIRGPAPAHEHLEL